MYALHCNTHTRKNNSRTQILISINTFFGKIMEPHTAHKITETPMANLARLGITKKPRYRTPQVK